MREFDTFTPPGVHVTGGAIYRYEIDVLQEKVARLEEIVEQLIGHQHQSFRPDRYGQVGHDTTRPIGMSGGKL